MQAKMFGAFIALLGFLLAITPIYIFPTCSEMITTVSGSTLPMKCFWSGRAELGIGSLIFAGGILTIFFSSLQAKLAISLMLFMSSLLALAVPAFLIGGCQIEMMACQLTTFPAVYVLSGIISLSCLVNAAYLYHKTKLENY